MRRVRRRDCISRTRLDWIEGPLQFGTDVRLTVTISQGVHSEPDTDAATPVQLSKPVVSERRTL